MEDTRDEALGRLLDEWASSIEPNPTLTRGLPPRRPRRDRIVRLTASVAVAVLFVAVALWGLGRVGRDSGDQTQGPLAPALKTVASPKGIPIEVSYPADWFAATNSGNSALYGTGLVVVNDQREATRVLVRANVDWFGTHIRDFVGVTVFKARHHPATPTDSSFPLDMADAKVEPGWGQESVRSLNAQVAGVPIRIMVLAAKDASPQDIAAADAIVASISLTGSTVAPPATVSVPNLVGRDLATAKSILAEAGLTVDVSKVSSANPPGTIDRQSPDAGAIVAPGDTVHLDVSVGLPGNDLGALDCPSGQQYATMLDPPFKLTPTDPSETVEALVRTHFSGIQPTDQVTTSTSEAGDNVVISRSGAVIARAFLMPHLNEWLVSEVALCASSGVGAPSH